MIEGGRGLIGRQVRVFHLGELNTATVTAACALDPEGERLHA